MKGICFYEHGGPEVLQTAEMPGPAAGGDRVLVAVRAASVNHLDVFLRRGFPGLALTLPHVPGSDAAGVVVESGPEAEPPLAPGTRVVLNPGSGCGRCEMCRRGEESLCRAYRIVGEHSQGAYADLISAPASSLLPLPDDLGFEEAAACPLVFMTAWSMLVSKGGIRAGESVLVLAAGSGVGSAAVQIAKLSGCRVFAAAGSEEKLECARRLGADVLIDYRREEFDRAVRRETDSRGVDVVVDHVGADTWVRSLRAARRGGRILTCGATTGYDPRTDLRHIFHRQLQVIGSTMGSAGDFDAVMAEVFAGRLRPIVDRVLPLSEAAEAHRLIEARRVIGKLVLTP
jgi:NADPH:quinone reductase-like Zn-dependent oxidoreductase